MTPIRIAVLYGGILDVGGVETHLLSLFRLANRSMFSWIIFSDSSSDFSRKAANLSVQVIPWRAARVFDPIATFKLAWLLCEFRINVLHIHDNRSSVCGQLAALLLRIPNIVTIHIPPYHYIDVGKKYFKIKHFLYLKFSQMFTYSFASHVLFVSVQAYQEVVFRDLVSRKKTSLIQNGIDLKSFTDNNIYLSQNRENTNSIKTICFVGRLDRQKGVDILLSALKLISVNSSEFRLLIVGDGPELHALQETAKNGLADQVVFLGYRDNVREILMVSDIFVLPSRFEGMPIALLEAMAAGLPAVVTNVGDNAHLVHDGVTGYVVPSNNPSALAEKLQILMDNPELCKLMGNIAQQDVESYSDIKMVNEILESYKGILSGPG